jgi:hypothetical protein
MVHDDDGVPDPPSQGWLAPRSPIPITIRDHFAMSIGGILRFIFEADAWDSPISFQPGIPVTLDGTLELDFAPGVDVQSQVGRAIDLFDWSGVTPTGAFAIHSPHVWDLSHLYTNGEVTLMSVTTLPGDFNNDGTIDAADYVVWRKGLGTTYSQADYNAWRANFGRSAAGAAAVADAGGNSNTLSVPEPLTAALAALSVLSLSTLHRRFVLRLRQ